MLLVRLAEVSTALAATRSRLTKRDLLAALLREARAEEIEIVVSYLGGSLRQRRTGVGWRTLSDLPPPADFATLEVAEVDGAFAAMATLAGPGSAALRRAAVSDLLARATASEQHFLAGLVFGELRQGALDAQVQEALAVAYAVPVAAVRRAAMLSSSTALAAGILATEGLTGLAAVGLQVGTGIQPMLAASAADPAAAAERTGLPALVDHKLDGVRVQVHRDAGSVRIFTRSLDDITARLPEVVHLVGALPQQRLVLDGEVLAVRPDGRPEPFQIIAARTATSADGPSRAAHAPLRCFFFDLLHVDGRDLLDTALEERAEVMTRLFAPEYLVPRARCDSVAEVAAIFDAAVRQGYEGVVVKNLASPYAAGRRDAAWVKVKPRHTLDLVVIAAEWGHGRRRGWLSNLHLAARGAQPGQWIMLGKTFKGMTDQMLARQTEELLAREERRDASTVFVRPELVVEVACDGLQTSTRYPGGVALRFARVLRYRPDKSAAEADTLADVVALNAPLVPGTDDA